MIRTAPVVAILLLLGCGGERSPEQPASNLAVEEAKPAANVPELAGEWRVIRVEGQDTAGAGMTADFSGGRTTLATGCLRRAWTYTQKRNMVSFSPNPAGSTNCEGRTPSGTDETAYAAMDGANIAIFAKDGSEASLSGTGGTLTLQRR